MYMYLHTCFIFLLLLKGNAESYNDLHRNKAEHCESFFRAINEVDVVDLVEDEADEDKSSTDLGPMRRHLMHR